jgi:hypothetical protein
LSCLALAISGETGGFTTNVSQDFRRQNLAALYRPTEDGTHACGMRELPADDPSYQETKEWLEQVERGEWSVFQEGELDQAEIDRSRDAWKLPPPRRSEA